MTETVAQEQPKRRKRGVGRILLGVVLPSVLVLGLIGGGVAYTAVTVDSADRAAPTRLWDDLEPQDEDPAAAGARGRADTPLSKLLLPLPDGYVFGPDVGLYGNDGELGAAEAVALIKRSGKGLSGKKRRAFEKEVDRLGVQGVAVRSFADWDSTVVVTFEVARIEDEKRVRSGHRIRTELFEQLKFPKGPKVEGHEKADCYLAPEDDSLDEAEKDGALETMICLAYDSEVVVTMTAVGAEPFDKARVAKLLKRQMDHIASPGEYV
ncbi:hypothetical protein ACWENA_22770 [Streptomyces sp. NPDC004779]